MRDEELWKAMLDVYTEALGLYAGLALAAAVLVFTVLTLFPANSFVFVSLKGGGVVLLYSLLVFFTAWIGTRVIVAYEVISAAMRNLKSETRNLEDVDRNVIERVDPLRLKYRAYNLTGDSITLEVVAFVVIALLMCFLFYLYYFA
jgi:hypothetical protein